MDWYEQDELVAYWEQKSKSENVCPNCRDDHMDVKLNCYLCGEKYTMRDTMARRARRGKSGGLTEELNSL